MNKIRMVCLLAALAVIVSLTGMVAASAAEENFKASSLTAKDVNCRKCHTDTPHIIHAQKPVECQNCHGNKLSVSIPQCTKCHSGPIHKVHEDKVNSNTCSNCHTTIETVHNNLLSGAVCSHCHTNLIEVHGADISCGKCHRSPPNIVKPQMSSGMTVVCQVCHTEGNVAGIHGELAEKQACYNCHKGTSDAEGRDVPHIIHQTKVECKNCHQSSTRQLIIPECTKCHKVEELHAFGKIGKLNKQTGLQCEVCHKKETNPSSTKTATPTPTEIQTPEPTAVVPEETVVESAPQTEETEAEELPGFPVVMAVALLVTAYFVRRWN